MYSTEIPSNIATTREGNLTATDLFFAYNCTKSDTKDYAPLQLRATNSQTLTTSENSTECTYSYFPCHLKVNRDKLALISHLWKCKNGERLNITANSFTKTVDNRWTRQILPVVAVRMRKFCPLQEPIRLQDFFNSTCSQAEKRIITFKTIIQD